MKLSIHDRLILQSVLPQKGNFLEMTVVEDIKGKLEFSAREISKYEIVNTEGRVSWNLEKALDLKIEFLQLEHDTINKAFRELEDAKGVTSEHLKLYREFVIEKGTKV